MRNLRTDFRFGGFCGGSVRNVNVPGATDVVNTDYDLMPQIFAGHIRSDDVLVDIGCGKGRVINYWLGMGLKNRIVGLELNRQVAARTADRLRRFGNVTILEGDAVANLPADGTLFYMFNPISDPEVMARLRDGLAERVPDRDRFKLIYYAPVLLDVFRSDPRWHIEDRELKANKGPFRDRHRRVAVVTRRPG